MSGGGKKKQAVTPTAAGGKKRKAAARGEEEESQQIVDDAAADAEAEQHMVKESEQSAKESEKSASGASGGSRSVPAGLLERRLAKERKEKDDLAAKLAKLQEQVARQAEMATQSPRPASATKVMHNVEIYI